MISLRWPGEEKTYHLLVENWMALTTLSFFTQRCFMPSLVEIGTEVLEKKILNFLYVFSLFRNYFPLKKIKFLSPKDAFCQVWLKLTKWFWRRVLNFVNVLLLFRNYTTLEEGVSLHLNKLKSLILKDALGVSLVEKVPLVLKKMMKI